MNNDEASRQEPPADLAEKPKPSASANEISTTVHTSLAGSVLQTSAELPSSVNIEEGTVKCFKEIIAKEGVTAEVAGNFAIPPTNDTAEIRDGASAETCAGLVANICDGSPANDTFGDKVDESTECRKDVDVADEIGEPVVTEHNVNDGNLAGCSRVQIPAESVCTEMTVAPPIKRKVRLEPWKCKEKRRVLRLTRKRHLLSKRTAMDPRKRSKLERLSKRMDEGADESFRNSTTCRQWCFFKKTFVDCRRFQLTSNGPVCLMESGNELAVAACPDLSVENLDEPDLLQKKQTRYDLKEKFKDKLMRERLSGKLTLCRKTKLLSPCNPQVVESASLFEDISGDTWDDPRSELNNRVSVFCQSSSIQSDVGICQSMNGIKNQPETFDSKSNGTDVQPAKEEITSNPIPETLNLEPKWSNVEEVEIIENYNQKQAITLVTIDSEGESEPTKTTFEEISDNDIWHDTESELSEIMSISETTSDKQRKRNNVSDSDKDSVCEIAVVNRERRLTRRMIILPNEEDERPHKVHKIDLPEFIVPAGYCILCCQLLRNKESEIQLHCKSQEHRLNLKSTKL